MSAEVKAFFDPATFTITYVVADTASQQCAVIDPVLDYNPSSGRCSNESAQQVIDYIKAQGLSLQWILETHAHADHLSGAQVIKQALGGKIGIGEHISTVQKTFAPLFDCPADFPTDGSQFDHLFVDGEQFQIGELQGQVLYTPGHTPACVSYLIDDACFVGDTLFMPDYGTARTDFPGGNAQTLYASIQRILALPSQTRLFMCHDYMPGGREPAWETTIADELASNIMLNQAVSEDEFVSKREARDANLPAPKLILPSLQVNIRAGRLPEPAENGIQYLKIPLNKLG